MRRIIYNDDSQGLHEARPESARVDLESWVDRALSSMAIDTYVWCVAFPDLCMHQTQVGEVYGARFAQPPNSAAAAIEALKAEHTDVLHVVAERAKQRGVEFVASVRMNDTHGLFLDPDDPNISQFLLANPHYIIRRRDGVPERALDYSHETVRQHRLSIIEELIQNYDIDGIELDFTRWGKFFARDEAPFKLEIMNSFVGQVRQILDEAAVQKGRQRLVLGAQVPESLYLNHLCGLAPKTWVERGYLDYLIQCDFNCTNPQIPVGEFAAFCQKTPCTHHVRMGNMMAGGWSEKPFFADRETAAYKNNRSYGGLVLTPSEARGAAANIYGFGADGIGLWNICCNMGNRHKTGATGPDRQKFQRDMLRWIDAVSSPQKVREGARRYHFVPIYKRATLPVRNYPVNELRTGPTGEPVQIVHFSARSVGRRQIFRFLMNDGKEGEKLRGSLRLRMLNSVSGDAFQFDINGAPIDSAHVQRKIEADDELPAVWHVIDLAHCPPFAGDNELGMTPQMLQSTPYMEELDLVVETGSKPG